MAWALSCTRREKYREERWRPARSGTKRSGAWWRGVTRRQPRARGSVLCIRLDFEDRSTRRDDSQSFRGCRVDRVSLSDQSRTGSALSLFLSRSSQPVCRTTARLSHRLAFSFFSTRAQCSPRGTMKSVTTTTATSLLFLALIRKSLCTFLSFAPRSIAINRGAELFSKLLSASPCPRYPLYSIAIETREKRGISKCVANWRN